MMSDDMLSQDEIDALLRGTDELDIEEDHSDAMAVEDFLSPMERDALGEVGNISFGSSATALSTLLNQKVEITTPTVMIIAKGKLHEEFPHPYVAIQVKYTEGFSGTNLLVIKQEDAAIIADLMLGGDGVNPSELLGEIQLSAVQEAMNQMMGSSATSMSTIFSKRVDISPPSIDMLDLNQGEGTDRIPNDDILVKISFSLKVGELIDSNIMQLLPLDFAKGLVQELLNPESMEQASATLEKTEFVDDAKVQDSLGDIPYSHEVQPPMYPSTNDLPLGSRPSEPAANPNSYPYQQSEQFAQARTGYQVPQHAAQSQQGPQHYGAAYPGGEQPVVQPAAFSSFEQHHMQEAETKNLNMLMDIPLQVTVELGRTKRSVKDILSLSSGSIIELDKLAGEPVDILINNRLIAKGEVVVIDENFGVRVTDIISQSDRIKKLR
ncbi:flagellar motor switch phosphatase FliY [Bacillus dakarensis]|uniref:flagellar motor switch phosphatase FliY n=1 Tax=Robertmurraya dakarensis TaxID=1926278 RepID=UPI000981D750|nr:flagellar motor switch phosphatase FliY [Bacillus dakarensis]